MRISMKGVSGAVTALVIVAATFIVTLVLVGYFFGIFGVIGSQNSIIPAGRVFIQYSPSNGGVLIYLVLNNPGPETPVVTGVTVDGIPVAIAGVADQYSGGHLTSANSPDAVTITTGLNYLTVSGTLVGQLNVQPGATVIIQVSFSNGQTITDAAVLNSVAVTFQ